jgi:hypothetical protein
MLEAIEVLRLTPRERLRRRLAPLLDEAVRPVLEQAKKEARAITEHHQQPVRAFTFSPDDSPQEFRGYAAALRRAGLFNRFFTKTIILGWLAAGEFRHACAVWRGARKVYSKASAEKMARDFEQLAEHLEAIQKFRANDRLQAICGREFNGLATDFDGLLAVNALASEVARKFPGAGPGHQEARRFLLEGELETLKAMGIKEEVTTRSLSELADEVERFAKLKEAIEGNKPIKDLLGGHFQGVDTDCLFLSGTLQFVHDLRAAKVPEPLLAWFLQESLPQQCGRLRERVESLGAALRREGEARNQALQMSELDCQVFFGSDTLDEMPLAGIATRIERALAARDELPVWIEYRRQRAEVEEMGLWPILKAYEVANAPFVHLMTAYEHVFHRAVLYQAYKRYPELQRYSGTTQETARHHFQELDRRIIDLKRQQLSVALARSAIASGRNWGLKRERTGLSLVRSRPVRPSRRRRVRSSGGRRGLADEAGGGTGCDRPRPAVGRGGRPAAAAADLFFRAHRSPR